MDWKSLVSIGFAFCVVVISITVGTIAFHDSKAWFDAPLRLILSMSSVFVTLIISDTVCLKDSQFSNGSAALPPFVVGPEANLRPFIFLLFITSFMLWIVGLLLIGHLWRTLAGTADTLSTIGVLIGLSGFYFFAGVYVFIAYKVLQSVSTVKR